MVDLCLSGLSYILFLRRRVFEHFFEAELWPKVPFIDHTLDFLVLAPLFGFCSFVGVGSDYAKMFTYSLAEYLLHEFPYEDGNTALTMADEKVLLLLVDEFETRYN